MTRHGESSVSNDTTPLLQLSEEDLHYLLKCLIIKIYPDLMEYTAHVINMLLALVGDIFQITSNLWI